VREKLCDQYKLRSDSVGQLVVLQAVNEELS